MTRCHLGEGKMKKGIVNAIIAFLAMLYISCGAREEVSLDEAQALRNKNKNQITSQTIYKPGPPKYEIGVAGGTYHTYILGDPKSFNLATIKETITSRVTDHLYPTLFDYDAYEKKFIPDNASFEVSYDEDAQITYVDIELRNDLYWVTAGGSKIKVTADDVVFWYNEVEGDPAVQSSGYGSRFVENAEGELVEIRLEKTGELTARFIIPTIIANPLLTVGMSFGPYYLFKPAKDSGGAAGVLDVLSVATNPKDVPSAGKFMLTAYSPGQFVELSRNPNYWKKDEEGNTLPYIDKIIIHIIASQDAALLDFKSGDLTSYSARPEDLDSLIADKEKGGYDVYNAGPSLGSAFISFNQNPNALSAEKLAWFSNKYFRQAMSCIIPRERFIQEVYRGLAEPAYYFFARANMFFDEDINLQYRYDLKRAKKLLKKAGFHENDEGLMEDEQGNVLEFELEMGAQDTLGIDMAQLFAEEAKKVGVTIEVKPIDFQTLVEKLTKSYKWDAVMIALGSNYWPSGGNNVWPSSANLHLWYPLQSEPATEWEARIDELYQKGQRTIDTVERKKIYDEYQKILLEELPFIYLVYPDGFVAYKRQVKNLYLDNLSGSSVEYLYFE